MAAYKRTLKKVASAIEKNDFPGYGGDADNQYKILTAKIW